MGKSNNDMVCELLGCKSGKPGIIRAFEHTGDVCWLVYICVDCAARLGIKELDDLPRGGLLQEEKGDGGRDRH